MSSKVGCSDPSTMVDRVWLGGWVGGIGFGWRFGVDLRLDEGVGSVVMVA
jgi:hypothetical protein